MSNKISAKSELGETLIQQLTLMKVKPHVAEHRFCKRRWRFDLAWPDLMIAVEVQGGIYGRPVYCPYCRRQVRRLTKSGRLVPVREGIGHSSSTRIVKDAEKLNTATALGWRVFLALPQEIYSGNFALFLSKVLSAATETNKS